MNHNFYFEEKGAKKQEFDPKRLFKKCRLIRYDRIFSEPKF
jgi:hypothetical protein